MRANRGRAPARSPTSSLRYPNWLFAGAYSYARLWRAIRPDVEDVVSETVVYCWRVGIPYEEPNARARWVLRRRALDALRKRIGRLPRKPKRLCRVCAAPCQGLSCRACKSLVWWIYGPDYTRQCPICLRPLPHATPQEKRVRAHRACAQRERFRKERVKRVLGSSRPSPRLRAGSSPWRIS